MAGLRERSSKAGRSSRQLDLWHSMLPSGWKKWKTLVRQFSFDSAFKGEQGGRQAEAHRLIVLPPGTGCHDTRERLFLSISGYLAAQPEKWENAQISITSNIALQ